MDKSKIIELILTTHRSLLQSVQGLSEEQCTFSISGKWTAFQHLKHIELSISLLTKIFNQRDTFLLKNYCETTRGSRSYDEITRIYMIALAPGIQAPQTFVPAPIRYVERNEIFDTIKVRVNQLIACIHHYSEADLD